MVVDNIIASALATPVVDPGTALAVGLGIMSIVIAIVIWLASTRAAKIAEAEETPSAVLRKVDEEAYERARKIYEAAIDQLEDELSRVNTMARDLQAEVYRLNKELIRVRARLRPDDQDDPSGPISPGYPKGDAS